LTHEQVGKKIADALDCQVRGLDGRNLDCRENKVAAGSSFNRID
jgi:hypothetical protein